MSKSTDRPSGLILGGILVLIGVIFLLQNVTDWDLGNWNWWALFILIPAVGSLANAWRIYQAQGRLTAKARGPLVGGFALLLVTTILLFDLDWGTMWPLFLIIVGVGALIVR
jgi:hypothetical protein